MPFNSSDFVASFSLLYITCRNLTVLTGTALAWVFFRAPDSAAETGGAG